MRLHLNFLGLLGGLALLIFASGCSGINTRQSITPGTFLMPGAGYQQSHPLDSMAPFEPLSQPLARAN